MNDSSSVIPRYTPKKSKLISFRRWHLDAFLEGITWKGNILDIGGRKGVSRGFFRPPFDRVTSWEYVNINPEVNPDYLASAEDLPIPAETKDITLFSEVLEHLQHPEKALAEAYRVLVPGGECYLLTPFLFPLHADPDDYQRWLPQKYKAVLSELGFSEIYVNPMGGLFSVVYDLFLVACNRAAENNYGHAQRIRKYFLPLFGKFCMWADRKGVKTSEYITTGYFVRAVKPLLDKPDF